MVVVPLLVVLLLLLLLLDHLLRDGHEIAAVRAHVRHPFLRPADLERGRWEESANGDGELAAESGAVWGEAKQLIYTKMPHCSGRTIIHLKLVT